MIRLHTLGRLDLRDSEGLEIRSILSQPKRLALLAYLALQGRQGFVSRDQVLALFWPDQDDERARGALNRAIYYLRSSLGEGVLLSRGDDVVGLAAEAFWCDATELEAAVAGGRYRDALELYNGDLLEGFHVAGTAEFAQWLDGRRERLKELGCRSAWSVAESERLAGNADRAVQWGRWVVQRSPHDEASVQKLMSMLDSVGDRAGAVLEYERFAVRLASDLDLTPAPETRELLGLIRSREVATRSADVWIVPASGAEDRAMVSHGQPSTTLEGLLVEDRPAESNVGALPQPRAATPAKPRWRRSTTRALVAITVTVALALGALGVANRQFAPEGRRVLVSTFRNHTGDPSVDSLARLTTDAIERSVAAAVALPSVNAPGLQATVIRSERDGFLTRRLARAGASVSGEFYREGQLLYVRVRVTDAVHGHGAWAVPPILVIAPGLAEEVTPELIQRVTGAVVALRDPWLAKWLPIASAPPRHDALVEYSRGVRVARYWERREHFERAAQLDTTFTWALLEAASSGRGLDHGRARAILVDLDGKRERLTELQSAVLSAQQALDVGDRQGRHRALAVAASLAPARFLTEFAMSARDLNLPRRALQLLDQVKSKDSEGNELGTWWVRTWALHELGEHREELAVTRRVRAQMPRETGVFFQHMRALAALGKADEVMALVDSATSLPMAVGFTPGNVEISVAEELIAHGHPTQAEHLLRRAIEWYRSTPDSLSKPDAAWHTDDLAHALYLAEEWDEAQALYEKQVDAQPGWRVEYLGRLGAIAARRGDRAKAEKYLNDLGSLESEVEPYELGIARARIAAQLGDASRAVELLREGYRGGQGVDLHTDHDFAPIADDPAFREFVRPKG